MILNSNLPAGLLPRRFFGDRPSPGAATMATPAADDCFTPSEQFYSVAPSAGRSRATRSRWRSFQALILAFAAFATAAPILADSPYLTTNSFDSVSLLP